MIGYADGLVERAIDPYSHVGHAPSVESLNSVAEGRDTICGGSDETSSVDNMLELTPQVTVAAVQRQSALFCSRVFAAFICIFT